MSWKSLTRVSSKTVTQECQIGVSSKSVLPERCVIVSSKSKGVLQECRLSVSPQGVPQVGSLENLINKYCFCSWTYVWAFGFVGFLLFFSTNISFTVLLRWRSLQFWNWCVHVLTSHTTGLYINVYKISLTGSLQHDTDLPQLKRTGAVWISTRALCVSPCHIRLSTNFFLSVLYSNLYSLIVNGSVMKLWYVDLKWLKLFLLPLSRSGTAWGAWWVRAFGTSDGAIGRTSGLSKPGSSGSDHFDGSDTTRYMRSWSRANFSWSPALDLQTLPKTMRKHS